MMRLGVAVLVAILCLATVSDGAIEDLSGRTGRVGQTAAILQERALMPVIEKATGFVYLAVRQDLKRMEKAYGLPDRVRQSLVMPELTAALKTVETAIPFEAQLVAFDMVSTRSCSLLFVVHGTEGPIGLKLYVQPTKSGLVHRLDWVTDWAELEKTARAMDKLPAAYVVTIHNVDEDKPSVD